jgi:hypothetical protein
LLDQVRQALAVRHYSPKTIAAYVAWIRRFIVFHERRHPLAMGKSEVSAFLSSLAVDDDVSASTQNQALAALLFLYREVLERELVVTGLVHAKRPTRLPVVMTRAEVASVLSRLRGVERLMASLLYGAGLRLLECATLRVKDVDLGAGQLIVRRAKGQKDRVTLLPETLIDALRGHLLVVKSQHDGDLADGARFVALPRALRVKYAFARVGVRHPNDSEAARAPRPQNHDGVHARRESRTVRREESARPIGSAASRAAAGRPRALTRNRPRPLGASLRGLSKRSSVRELRIRSSDPEAHGSSGFVRRHHGMPSPALRQSSRTSPPRSRGTRPTPC